MKNIKGIFIFVLLIAIVAACSSETEHEDTHDTDELIALEVDFQVPEQADVGETVELKAIVTYGDEKVTDADEVEFEYWQTGNEEESIRVPSTNNGDGSYTAEVTFDTEGTYEMYAHTTAKDMHTMPKKSITVGKGASAVQE